MRDSRLIYFVKFSGTDQGGFGYEWIQWLVLTSRSALMMWQDYFTAVHERQIGMGWSRIHLVLSELHSWNAFALPDK